LKSCVVRDSQRSDYFSCNIGVRQGENLSPLLFALYINDFELFIKDRYPGVDLLPKKLKKEMSNNGIEVFMKLFSLLYADDTIVIATNECELQSALDGVSDYCKLWLLKVNVTKTKVVIFSKGKVKKYEPFTFDGEVVEVVDEYTYLGVVFNYNNTLKKAQDKQIIQAKRAMYSLIIKSRKLRLPLDIQVELFDRIVVPVLIYGSEVWGFENIAQIEALHAQYCKQLLRLRKSTMNSMALGELGRFEISLMVKERMVNYWFRTISGKEVKYSTTVCNILKLLRDNDIFSSKWIRYVHTILHELGMSNLWYEYEKTNCSWVRSALKLRLSDTYSQNWHSKINDSTCCLNYRIFKTKVIMEPYLVLMSPSLRIALAKLRCGNHRLPVVTGRYNGIERKDRICELCDKNKLGDEFHYLFECPILDNERKTFIKSYYRVRPNVMKMSQLFNSVNYRELANVSKLCGIIMALYKK